MIPGVTDRLWHTCSNGAEEWHDQMDYERTIAQCAHPEAVGIPQSWSTVEQGFLPLSPDRVVTIHRSSLLAKANRRAFLAPHLESALNRIIGDKFPDSKSRLPAEKLWLIASIVQAFARYYHRWDIVQPWLDGLVWREHFCTTGVGRHVAFLHQFQRTTGVPVVNQTVDWWLFIVPDGIDWQTLDQSRVHLLLAIVFPTDVSKHLHEHDTHCLAFQALLRTADLAFPLLRMTPEEAARSVNIRVAKTIQHIWPDTARGRQPCA